MGRVCPWCNTQIEYNVEGWYCKCSSGRRGSPRTAPPPPPNPADWPAATDYTLVLHTRMDGEGRPGIGRGPCTGDYQLWARDGRGRQGQVVHDGEHAHDEGEYLTLLAALTDLAGRITGAGRDPANYTVTIYSGRELVVEQLTGGYRVKAPALQLLHGQSCELIARFGRVDMMWKQTTAIKRLFRF